MLFNTTEEQQMLEDMVGRVLADTPLTEEGEIGPDIWSTFAELGLLAIPFDEDDGGMGGSTEDLSIVARALGKVPGDLPFTDSVAVASRLFKDLSDEALKAAYLPGLLDGSAVLSVAHIEADARYSLSRVETAVADQGSRRMLTGIKTHVGCGALATAFIVSACVSGEVTEREGVSLFVVPADAPGVTVTPFVTHDGRRDAEVRFDRVTLDPAWQLGADGQGVAALELANDLAIVVSCCEAVGAMEEILAQTVEYLQVRKQFGVPIATFQSLQHKAVDMFVEIEQAKSMTAYAITAMEEAEGASRALAMQAAKAHLNAAARFVAEAAVQLHGAIGMTIETKTGRLFQRLTNFQLRHGDRHHCMQSLIRAGDSILEN